MSHKKTKSKTKSKKEISEPTNFQHLEHRGPLDIQTAVLDSDKESDLSTKTVTNDNMRALQSSGFLEALRTIIREEMVKTVEEEIGRALEKDRIKLLNEINGLRCSRTAYSSSHETCVKYSGAKGPTNEKPQAPSDDIHSYSSKEITDPEIKDKPMHAFHDSDPKTHKDKPSPAPRQRSGKDCVMASSLEQQHLSDSRTDTSLIKRQTKPGAAIRRECLSKAIQASIIEIVEQLDFNHSDLPDQLISAGHITEEECSVIRNEYKSRKDQVRYIVSRTKCRSLQDMEKFLEVIEQQIPTTVLQIRKKFKENLNTNDNNTKCSLCLCYDNIDVKEAADSLWSIMVISDSVYKEITDCSRPRGCQKHMWKKLVGICNGQKQGNLHKLYDKLFEFISKRGNFEFIVNPLKAMLTTSGKLECHCQSTIHRKPIISGRASRESSGVLSSCTPRSSSSEERRSIFSGDFSKESDIDDDRMRESKYIYRPFMRQSSLNDDKTDQTIPKQRLYQSASLEMLGTITEETNKTFKNVKIHPVDFHRSETALNNMKGKTLDLDIPIRKEVPFNYGAATKRHGFASTDFFDNSYRSSDA